MDHHPRSDHADARRPWRRILPVLSVALIILLILATAGTMAAPAPIGTVQTPMPPDIGLDEGQALEDVEHQYRASYAHLATGDPLAVPDWKATEMAQTAEAVLATHATYVWPFTPTGGLGWNMQSYQNYGGTPYFHHGIDMMAVNGTDVFNRSGGQVVNVENYQPGNDLYWEVAVLDPQGYIWQYHHIDKNTIPQAIKNAFAAYQANPTTGGFIAPNTYIGDIVYWTVTSFGYRFNHIHLNILAAGGVYVNPMEFHTPLADTSAPLIQAIGLLKNNTVQTGNTITPAYGLYVRSKDLIVSTVYYLPPYKAVASVDGGQPFTVWEFVNLPGGASDTAYLADYYVVPPTCGDYSCREYYIDLGFTTAGQRALPNVNGSHTVNVTVYDYNGNTASGSFTWTVTGGISNTPPVANPQTVTTAEDTATGITLTGSDAEGNPLTYSVASAPSHGTLSGTAPNLIYTPAADFNGADSFTFKANDGTSDSATATVGIAVTAANDPPVANDQSVAAEQEIPVAITLTGSDVDGDALATVVVSEPTNGALSGTAPDLTYTPAAGYLGSDTFTFLVNDGTVDSAPATVSIAVNPINHAPVAGGQSVLTDEDTPAAITLTGSDEDGDALTYTVTGAPANGTLSGTAPALTYTPAANTNGADSFTFIVNDGKLNSSPATVDIIVQAVNDAPIGNGQSVTTQQNTAVAITLAGSDVDGDALTYNVTVNPAHGTLSGTAPNLTYAPAAGYSGPDSFTFTASDGSAVSAAATVSITVTPAGPLLYLGSSTSGTAGGVAFADEDILVKNQGTGAWALFIDGSDIGLANTDIDAFDLLADGSLLMSFDADLTLTGFGTVDDSDIVRFIPTSTGSTTAGTWSWYFDGSDVGLTTNDEDVDAFTRLGDGRLLVSTLGNVSVAGASGADEDLLAFTPAQLGATTSGAWAMVFDGSDVGLSSTSNEDVNGVWVDAAGKLYLTTVGSFSVTGASGDGSDIFTCTPSSLGSTTACTWAMYWDGSVQGFSGEDTDSLSIIQ